MTQGELRSIWQQHPDIGGMTIQQIANDYETLPHEPEHISYAHFTDFIGRQYRYMTVSLGLKVIQVEESEPYVSSVEMFADIDKGKLKVSTIGSPLAENHPLGDIRTPFGITKNIMFRAVHDFFGHYGGLAGGGIKAYPFETFAGEMKAFRRHRAMLPKSAHLALFSETIAQLAWFYTHGAHVPLQKCVIYRNVKIGQV